MRVRRDLHGICLALILLLCWGQSGAEEDTWIHRQGPFRNGTVPWASGFGSLSWPPGKPTWSTQVGLGSSSPIIAPAPAGEAEPRLYVSGWEEGFETLYAFKAYSGEPLWTAKFEAPVYGRYAIGDQGLYKGTHSTPEFDLASRRIFTLGTDGELMCWDEQGDPQWNRNLYRQMKVGQRPKATRMGHRDYGYTSSPFAAGSWVMVEVGSGEYGNVVAFNKSDGAFAWGSENRDEAGHNNGPSAFLVDGVPCLASFTLRGLVVMRLDPGNEGKTVAEIPWATDYAQNVASPATAPNHVIITSEYNQKRMACFRISLNNGASMLWEQKVASKVCTPVIYKRHVYVAFQTIRCLDVMTGEIRWQGGKGFGPAGSLIAMADDRLLAYGGRGQLALFDSADRSPDTYQMLAEKDAVFRSDVWPHAVFANERLYLKDRNGHLQCHALDGSLPAAGATDGGGDAAGPAPVVPSLQDDVQRGLVFGWQVQAGRDFFMQPRGTKPWSMAEREGGLMVEGASDHVLSAFKGGNAMTIETLIRPESLTASGPAPIITFSKGAKARNFTLGQEGDQLVLRLRTGKTGANGNSPELNLGRLTLGAWHWVSIVYEDGKLACLINGEMTARSTALRGRFTNWERMPLLFKNDVGRSLPWLGDLYHVALYSEAMAPFELKARYEQLRAAGAPQP